MSMTDNQLRGIVLQKLYDLRSRARNVATGYVNFDPVPRDALGRIFEQLAEYGLITWRPTYSAAGAGSAKILAKGIDVVEGVSTAPVPIQIDQSRHVTFANAHHNIVGDNNTQFFNLTISEVFERIERATVSEDAKQEAKSVITKAFEHPVVKSVVGSVTEAGVRALINSAS